MTLSSSANVAWGFECPGCTSTGEPRLHSVLAYLNDAEGVLDGLRLHCLRCEVSWTETFREEPS